MCGEIRNQESEIRGKRATGRYAFGVLAYVLLVALLCGCAACPPENPAHAREFEFRKDTFAFPNELLWEYHYDAEGKWRAQRREPKPQYTLHCFVMARSAAQFFESARFAPKEPVADESTYRRLIHRVASTNLRRPLPESKKIVIPGYADLRDFSRAQEALLKAECGSVWQSYFQRGNWRMILPFSRRGQKHVAEHLLQMLENHQLPVVHLVRFPQLTINHAVIVFQEQKTEEGMEFKIYDPNQPAKPATLYYQRATRTFVLPASDYFPGGRVDVYQIYSRWDY